MSVSPPAQWHPPLLAKLEGILRTRLEELEVRVTLSVNLGANCQNVSKAFLRAENQAEAVNWGAFTRKPVLRSGKQNKQQKHRMTSKNAIQEHAQRSWVSL